MALAQLEEVPMITRFIVEFWRFNCEASRDEGRFWRSVFDWLFVPNSPRPAGSSWTLDDDGRWRIV